MNNKTTTETREAVGRTLRNHGLVCMNEKCKIKLNCDIDYEIMQLIAKEKQDLLEDLKANLPEADKEEAIKHRPDNSVGFMLGWNAYESKLSKKLAEMRNVLEAKEGIYEEVK